MSCTRLYDFAYFPENFAGSMIGLWRQSIKRQTSVIQTSDN
jgi:hypothetical protein